MRETSLPTVKIGPGRRVVIPKAIHDRLGLARGDRLDVAIRGRQLVLTPQSFVEDRLAQAFADIRKGRVYGPYRSVKALMRSLESRKKKTRKRAAS